MNSKAQNERPSWPSEHSLLVTSLCILLSMHLVMSATCSARDVFLRIDFAVAIEIVIVALAVAGTIRFMCSNGSPLISLVANHWSQIGPSCAITALALTLKSFYLSFHDFEESLAWLYLAFVLAMASVYANYSKGGVPSSAVVLSAAHASLFLAFFGLAMVVTPHMMNPAFIAAFTATFSLAVSGALFLLHTARADPSAEKIFCVSSVLRPPEVQERLRREALDEMDRGDEVFSDQDSLKSGEVSSCCRSVGSDCRSEPLLSRSEPTLSWASTPSLDSDSASIMDSIIEDLTEQARSVVECAEFLGSKLSPISEK